METEELLRRFGRRVAALEHQVDVMLRTWEARSKVQDNIMAILKMHGEDIREIATRMTQIESHLFPGIGRDIGKIERITGKTDCPRENPYDSRPLKPGEKD